MCLGMDGGYIEPKEEKKTSLLKRKTNFDRIKEMTIDEMAAAIMCPNEIVCLDEKQVRCEEDCVACCKKWLESEVKE